jgi:zinc transport system substrate-binding protein
MSKRWAIVGVVIVASVITVYVFFRFRASPPASTGKIVVFTSIVPQEYFVERIGGNRVEVQALVKPGSSPATYEPTPRQMAALSEARLYFRIGIPFENALLPNIEETMKGLRIVDTRKGITLRAMKAHHHDESEDHQHDGGNDPHIWLNPRLVKLQAQTIAEALIEVDPDGKDVYKKNLAAFLKDLDVLDAKLAEALAPVKGKTFLVFHPAWGYFADAYGLEQEPIEIEGKEPSAKQLARIIEEAKEEGVRVIFVQPQFSQASAEQIAEAIGGAVVPIDPLARDYITNLEAVAAKVGALLEKQQ